jgi:hypothetical protein
MTKAIEFFGIAENLRFRVAAEQIIEAPEAANARRARLISEHVRDRLVAIRDDI